MVIKRDTRTALEKWDQGISEAHFRGYWHLLQHPTPEGLFCGWDHTKPTSRNYAKHDLTPVQLRSRGTIEADCRDDTPDEVFITVTTYPPVTRQRGVGVDQTKTRFNRIQCLPPRKQDPENRRHDLWSFCNKMQIKAKSSKPCYTEVGPLWKEWCVWDDQYLWERHLNQTGLEYRGQAVREDFSLTDLGYRRVRSEMERLAWNQGIQSWTQLSRREPEFALAVLYGRFEKYLLFSNHVDVGKPRPLPQCWGWEVGSPRLHHLNYDIRSHAFKVQLGRWIENLYYQDAREEDMENDKYTSHQACPPSYTVQSLPPLRNNTASQLQRVASQSMELVQGDGQYQYRQNHQTPPTLNNGTRQLRDESQTEHLLPAGLFVDDDYFQQQHRADQNHAASIRTVTAVGDRPRRRRPSDDMTRGYSSFY